MWNGKITPNGADLILNRTEEEQQVAAKDVFISYKAEEFDEADWVRGMLEQNGISCWMAPESIMGGSSYAEEIPRAIRECKVFVLILSERSQRSRWVPRELDQAINEGRIIMPFMLENCALKDDFRFYLTNVQRYEAYAGRSAAIGKMIREIRALIGADERQREESQPETEESAETERTSENRPLIEVVKTASDPEPEAPLIEVVETASDPESEVPLIEVVKTASDTKSETPVKKNRKKGRKRNGTRVRIRRFEIMLAVIGVCLAAFLIKAIIVPGITAAKIAGASYSRDETYLSLQEKELTAADISSIAKMGKLRSLVLTDCTIACEDLSPLVKEGLGRLELVDCGLTEGQIASLDFSGSSLYHLNLSGNGALTSLELLQSAADTLTRLEISRTGIRDLSMLGQFPGLVDIRADKDQIDRMPLLTDCPKLESVSLNGNQLTDLSFLEGSARLKVLAVNGNQLSSLKGLESCIYLEEIQAGSNRLTELAGLENTTLLNFVFLNDNQLTDLSVLEHSAASLEQLYIRNNQVEDLSFLTQCLSLQYLNLDHNSVQSLESLRNCGELKALSAMDNQIRTTQGIERLKKLIYLDLSGNGLTEAGVEQPLFSGSVDPVILDLSNNQLSSLNIDTEVKFSLLYVYGNSLKEFGHLLASKTSCLAVDFDEYLDFNTLSEGEHYDVKVLHCPLNWQVAVKDILGSRVSFVEEEELPDALEKSYRQAEIKGVEEYY